MTEHPVWHALTTRRTIHDYRPDPLPEGALERALEAALRAPNHKLTNPWRFTRLGPKARATLTDLGVALKTKNKTPSERLQRVIRAKFSNPPELLVISQVIAADPARAREDYAAIACAIQNLCLSLWAEGIGSKWSSGAVTTHPDTYAMAMIPPGEEIVGFVWIGYPELVPNPGRAPLDAVLRQTP